MSVLVCWGSHNTIPLTDCNLPCDAQSWPEANSHLLEPHVPHKVLSTQFRQHVISILLTLFLSFMHLKNCIHEIQHNSLHMQLF